MIERELLLYDLSFFLHHTQLIISKLLKKNYIPRVYYY